jgi:hypothetical protein
MVIRRITPNILTCSTPFLRFGRIKIGGRGTIVKLRDNSLAVFSPVALTSSVKQQMQEQFQSTDVKYITALDNEHHIFLESWHKEWPQAKIIGPEMLPETRDKQGYFKIPEGSWKLFKKGDEKSWSVDETFDAEFDREYIPGHANKELVFNHKPSKTLIEADLMFNLPATEQFSKTGLSPTSGFLTRLFCAVNHSAGEALWQRRVIWYAISSGDRKGFNESVSRIAKWDFDRIIPCHGDVIESGGKRIFEKVMQWHLEAAKKGH